MERPWLGELSGLVVEYECTSPEINEAVTLMSGLVCVNIQYFIGSQWRDARTGVMCDLRLVFISSLAAGVCSSPRSPRQSAARWGLMAGYISYVVHHRYTNRVFRQINLDTQSVVWSGKREENNSQLDCQRRKLGINMWNLWKYQGKQQQWTRLLLLSEQKQLVSHVT